MHRGNVHTEVKIKPKQKKMHQIKHAKVNTLEGNVLRFGDLINIHKHYLITR
jgi:hypothetical protein